MTKISPKAPQIQHVHPHERSHGDTDITDFREFLKTKPTVERRETGVLSQPHEAPFTDRDAGAGNADAQGDWERLLTKRVEPASKANVEQVASSLSYATKQSRSFPHRLQEIQSSLDLLSAGIQEVGMPVAVELSEVVQGAIDATGKEAAVPDVCGVDNQAPIAAELSEAVHVDADTAEKEDVVPDVCRLDVQREAPSNSNLLLPQDLSPPPKLQAMCGDEIPTVAHQTEVHAETTVVADQMGELQESRVITEEPQSVVQCLDAGEVNPPVTQSAERIVAAPPKAAEQSQVVGPPATMDVPITPGVAPPAQSQSALPMHTRIGQDDQDWLIRPWRLQANAGLSYRSDQSPASIGAESTSLLPGTVPRVNPMAGAVVGEIALDQEPLPERWKNLLRLPAHVEVAQESVGMDGIDASDPARATGGQIATWQHWSQRMLRWNGNTTAANGVTAWVRDYALEASEIPVLIQSLLVLSEVQGLPLGRVMINGHEAWTATGYLHITRGDNDGR